MSSRATDRIQKQIERMEPERVFAWRWVPRGIQLTNVQKHVGG